MGFEMTILWIVIGPAPRCAFGGSGDGIALAYPGPVRTDRFYAAIGLASGRRAAHQLTASVALVDR